MPTNRNTWVGLSLTAPLACALLLPLVSPAQQNDSPAEYIARLQEPGRNRIPIALPAPNALGSVDETTFYEVLANDLELSGWVEVIDRDAYIEPAGTGIKPGEFNYADWEITGAVGLAKTNLSSSSGRLRSEVWVYDVGGERRLGAKAFTTDDTRALAHKVANEVIFQLTGQQGMFNTRFAAATNWSGNKEITIVDFEYAGGGPVGGSPRGGRGGGRPAN